MIVVNHTEVERKESESLETWNYEGSFRVWTLGTSRFTPIKFCLLNIWEQTPQNLFTKFHWNFVSGWFWVETTLPFLFRVPLIWEQKHLNFNILSTSILFIINNSLNEWKIWFEMFYFSHKNTAPYEKRDENFFAISNLKLIEKFN